MAKKQAVNKTQAVRDYLKTHRGAMSGEIATALRKQGIKITPGHVANIKSQLKRRSVMKAVAAKSAEAPVVETATVQAEKPSKPGDTITLDQVRAVAQTVKAVGGFGRLNELLALIREVGGLKRFKDLLEAISLAGADELKF